MLSRATVRLRTQVISASVLLISFGVSAGNPDDKNLELTSAVGAGVTPRAKIVSELIDSGKYDEALAEARHYLAEAELIFGQNSMEVARACDRIAETMWRSGHPADPDALLHARRAISIKQRLFGSWNQELADSFILKARLLEHVGQPRTGLQVLEEAVAIHETLHNLNTANGIRALTELGRMLCVMGHYAASELRLERAAELAEAHFGDSHPLTASTWHELGCLLFEENRYGDARRYLEKALEVRHRTLGPDHPLVAETLNELGWTCRIIEDLETARLLLERSLEIGTRSLEPSHPTVTQTLDSLGMLYWYAGLGGEQEAFDRARSAIRAAHHAGYWKAGLWLCHEGMVVWWNQRQNFLTAIRKYRAAATLFERTLGAAHPRTVYALRRLCDGLQATGQVAAAATCYERRTELIQEILERGDAPPTLEVDVLLMEVGRIQSEGRLREARDVLLRVLKLQLQIHGPFNNYVAWTEMHIAGLSQALGEYDEARRMIEEARLSWEGVWGKRPWVPVMLARSSLAEATGDLVEARLQYELAMRTGLDPAHPGTGPRWVAYADFLLRIGDVDESLQAALEGERKIRPHLRLTIPSLSEREGLRFAAAWASGLDVVFSVAANDPRTDTASAAFDRLIRSRALVLDAIASRQQLAWGTGDATVTELASTLSETRSRLASLLIRGPPSDDLDSHMNLVDEARREKEALERQLSNRSLAFRASQQNSVIGLQALQQHLPRGDALVSYALYVRRPIGSSQSTDRRAIEPSPAYIAFVLKEGETTAIPLGGARLIDSRIEALRKRMYLMAASGGRSSTREERLYRESGEALRSLIWDPISPHIGDSARVFVVPDGALNLVNFAALPLGSTGYVVDSGHQIHYLSAERDLVAGDVTRAGSGFLAMGDPAFDERRPTVRIEGLEEEYRVAERLDQPNSDQSFRGTRSACNAFGAMRFDRLPASRLEVQEVAETWNRGRGITKSEYPATGAQILVGDSASEPVFKALAPGHRVLHLATHGFFLGEGCASVLDRSTNRGFDGLPESVVGENPLILSGLVLAGANHRESCGADEDDGVLTAEEIASLDLSGVEWAVLSACDTGIGEARVGEGVFGLRRAFQIAGARSLIMSLWPVEDESSREWMKRLYANRFEKHLSTVDSVHRSSFDLLQQRRREGLSTHPFFWAGFVAAGDWR